MKFQLSYANGLAAAMLLGAAAQVYAFGGGIAVAMARLTEEDQQLDVSSSGRATFETEEYNIEERLFHRPGKLREEMQPAGQDMVVITRQDPGKMWMLMSHGMYMEHDVGTSVFSA